MEVIPGKRKNSFLYVYEGYMYNIDSRYNYIYRCAKRRINFCKGVLIKENEKYILSCEHSHPNEPYIIDIVNLKKEMIQMCKETTMSNKEIFDTVSRSNPNAAAFLSYHAMRTLLSREKIKMRPPLPSSRCDLHNLLQGYERTKEIYKGYVISDDNKCSYIFTTDKLLKILDKSSEIFIDGTFSVVPKTPSFIQLFSIHVRYMDKGIAVLFILCEARTQFMYKSIWKEIVKLTPNLQSNLRFIMMDYERASMNAVHEQFPNASLRGCWFHYCQAVLKKWKQLGLLKIHCKIISMAMTLALAPSEMFSEGLSLMQIIADEESDNYPNVLLFMKYMRSTWLPISEKISVYKCPIRTNNLVESFHNIMAQRMQTVHPNLWVFLDNISKLIIDQEIKYNRLLNGLQISRNRSQFNKYRNIRIHEAQNCLSTGIYSLKEFLQIFDGDIRQCEMTSLGDDNNDDDICADLHTGGAIDAVDIETKPQNIQRRRRTQSKYNSNELEDKSTNIEEKNQSSISLTSENITDKNEETMEGNAIMIDGNKNNEKSSDDDDEEHIYEVPYDDYGYWNNESVEDSIEENIPFLSIKNMNSNINKTSLYQEGKCIICLDEKSKIVFTPCGHLSCCKNCIEKLLQQEHKKCPLCNNTYDEYISIITP